MTWDPNPPASWYEQPDPVICCDECEDNPDHDSEACLDAQREDAAEARAERDREDRICDRD